MDEQKEMLLRSYIDGFEKIEKILDYIKDTKWIEPIDKARIQLAWETEFGNVCKYMGSTISGIKVVEKTSE